MEPQETMIVQAIEGGAFKDPEKALVVLQHLNIRVLETFEGLMSLFNNTESEVIKDTIHAMILAMHGISGTITLMLVKQSSVSGRAANSSAKP